MIEPFWRVVEFITPYWAAFVALLRRAAEALGPIKDLVLAVLKRAADTALAYVGRVIEVFPGFALSTLNDQVRLGYTIMGLSIVFFAFAIFVGLRWSLRVPKHL